MSTYKAKKVGEVLKPAFQELSEQVFKCPIHGTYQGKPCRFFLFPNADPSLVNPECPKCAGEREAKETAEKAERKKAWELDRLKAMNIGRRYWDTGFEHFSASTDELKRHLKAAENFAANPDGKMVMLGEHGTGKTHLAVSILKKTGGIIYTAYEIGVRLRRSYGGDSKEWDVLKELCDAEMLVIDEIGRTKGEAWELNWMSHIINKRHENMRPLVLISNRHSRKDCPHGKAGCEKCLEKFFDNDVISRIVEDGIVLRFTGVDYRQNNGEEYRNQKRAENA
jgi:DNA replication protein DnaC